MKKQKRTIFCGVENMDGTPAKLTKEQRKKFIDSMSNGGKNNVVFCEDNTIPKTMKIITAIISKDK